MPGHVHKIGTFSEWKGLFDEWRKEIGVDHDDIRAFHFETLYGRIETEEIQFGHYKGRRKILLGHTDAPPGTLGSETVYSMRDYGMIAGGYLATRVSSTYN